jgi:hypothetical protein
MLLSSELRIAPFSWLDVHFIYCFLWDGGESIADSAEVEAHRLSDWNSFSSFVSTLYISLSFFFPFSFLFLKALVIRGSLSLNSY